jgi:hypothetical protein
MRFDTRTLPMVGLLATRVGWPLQLPPRQPTGHTRRWAHRGADGRVAHRVALTVAKLPAPRWKG